MKRPNRRKILLDDNDIPKYWYNIKADLPELPPPPVNPGTGEPLTPDLLSPIFPEALILQEVTMEREVEIPEPVRDVYRQWRPTPLFYAEKLCKHLDTPALIFYKYEGVSPPGSHKPNTAVAQAFYNKNEGVKRLTTETGAGQWGSALSFAGMLFGIEVKVYMVKVSYYQKPGRRILMESYGASVTPSPSRDTEPGRKILEQDPDSMGSLGIAISEAVFDAATRDDTKYSLGSVLDHVLLHQTVVGLEAKRQMELLGYPPDILIGCVGGGSNFAGFVFPFLEEKIRGKREMRVIAVEPESCPTLTRGVYSYDFGDTARMTPLLKMFTLGHTFMPPGIHAGGLRYHGMAPLVSHLYRLGIIEARAYHQTEVFDAALLFAKTEGLLPAPESAHAVKAAIDEALKAKEEGEEKVIVFNLSGHGYFDLSAYEAYLSNKLEDYAYPREKVDEALKVLEAIIPANVKNRS
jgi:tryptophan synthase beta chain